MATRYQARHDDCGYLGKPTTRLRAERALREHWCPAKQEDDDTGEPRPGPGTGLPCGLSIDLPDRIAAPAVGDWIATRAGSRYLITASQPVQPHTPRQLVRHQLRCLRLTKHCPIPDDVRVIRLRWYPR